MTDEANINEEQKEANILSPMSWIFAILSILVSLFLSYNSFSKFYRMKFLGERKPNFKVNFFTENSLMWAHLVFGFLFLGGIYLTYKGIKEKQSFYIFMSVVYIFALVSLFISYIV